MNYLELLSLIDIWKYKTQGYDDTYAVHGILNALRAVIELHCPEGKPDQQCKNCRRFYPCPTIQAIQKELK